MYPIVNLGGEGASTHALQPAATSVPSLVVWPILPSSSANSIDASQRLSPGL